MSSIDCVEQKGIIKEIANGIARVSITSFSACASCRIKGACQMSESTTKIVDVKIENANFKKGDNVKVLMKKTMGLKATLYAYILPVILVIISLIVFSILEFEDYISAILSLLLLVPYYLVISLLKNKLKKTFQFTLIKDN